MPIPGIPAYPPQTGYGQSLYSQDPRSALSSGGSYNPFDPTFLYAPMSQQIDAETQGTMGQLREQFGNMGARNSSGLMNAMSTGLAKAAADKARLMSQLMYQGAQDTYGRQKDAAGMNMQLGQMQDQRDAQMAQQLAQMGLSEKGAATQDLMAQYKEWLRTNEGYLPELLSGVLGHGYQSDFLKDPSFWQKYGGLFSALGSAAGGTDWSQFGSGSGG